MPGDSPVTFSYRKSANERVLDAVRRARDLTERKAVRRIAALAAVLLLAIGGWFTYLALRPIAVPDTEQDDIEDILDFTMLSDQFNRLPLKERLDLLKGVVSRLKGMGDGDSGLMAAFAAGLTSEALDQLRKNGERLMVDLWDSFSEQYEHVPAADRESFLDGAFLDMIRMAEDIGGFNLKQDESKQLSDAKNQSKRDMERARQGAGTPMQRNLVNRLVTDMQSRFVPITSVKQRDRMTRFSRDFVRHMRNQDLDTGKDRDAPAPPGGTPSRPPAEPPAGPPAPPPPGKG